MLSKILNFLLLSVIIGLAAYYFYMRPSYSSGDVAPTFTTELADGKPFDLASLKGDYVLLNFWGSWCGPCRRTNPKLVELHNHYKNHTFHNGEKFHIVSVGIEKDMDSWTQAVEYDKLTWPLHIVTTKRFDGEIAQLYGVKSIPSSFLIGPNGEILLVNESVEEIESFLASK